MRSKDGGSISSQMLERVKSGLKQAHAGSIQPNLKTNFMDRANEIYKRPPRKPTKLDGKRETYNLLEDQMLRIKHERITSPTDGQN